MRLDNNNAIIYGAGGAIGGAVARAFARAGAKVFLAGRTLDPVEAVAKDITAEGGFAEAAQVDAMDATAVRDTPTMWYAATAASTSRSTRSACRSPAYRGSRSSTWNWSGSRHRSTPT